ncbi:hypothetical protein, partial [Klebsiella pneumoniae]|uniref:hypothetical protein n=1 Tax=Klebsiella pneumoniae TaxID=573 RepID=UPI001BE0C851
MKALKGKVKAEETSVAVESDEGYVFSVSQNSEKTDWLLDSGCSFHMCSLKEYFSSYKKCKGGTVRMA